MMFDVPMRMIGDLFGGNRWFGVVSEMDLTPRASKNTHHKDGSPGSQCVEGVPGSFVRSHTFQFVTPAMTDKYKMPNPWTSCHIDKTATWATGELEKWSNVPPWRVGD